MRIVLFFFFLLIVSSLAIDATFKLTEGIATVTSTQAVPGNGHRTYFIFQNKGTDSIFLKVDSVHIGTEGIEISAGGNYEPFVAPTNSIFIKAASGSQTFSIIEG